MLKVDIAGDAAKFIATREPKHQEQIRAKITSLRQDPRPPDHKLLRGLGRQFLRADVGEYRVVYWADDDALHVHTVGKRNDDEVYRRLR
jgi:mRNA interferase RelE/StbE